MGNAAFCGFNVCFFFDQFGSFVKLFVLAEEIKKKTLKLLLLLSTRRRWNPVASCLHDNQYNSTASHVILLRSTVSVQLCPFSL